MKLVWAICIATVVGVAVYFSLRATPPSKTLREMTKKPDDTLTYAMTAVLALDQHGAPIPSSRPDQDPMIAVREAIGEDFPGPELQTWVRERSKSLKSVTLATDPPPLSSELKDNRERAAELAFRALGAESIATSWWERATLLEALMSLDYPKDKLRSLSARELVRCAAGETPFEAALAIQRVFLKTAASPEDALETTLAAIAASPSRVVRHLWASQLVETYPELESQIRERIK